MSTTKRYTPEERAHLEWMGFVQPVGVVVSLPALEKAQCYVQKNVIAAQAALGQLAQGTEEDARVASLPALCVEVLEWNDGDLRPATDAHAVALPEHQDVLAADYVVGDPAAPLMLVMVQPEGTPLDTALARAGWQASPQARLERLLRDQGVPIGLLFNQEALRLVYAPSGESSGHATFLVRDMLTVAGRPILGGLLALLSAPQLFGHPSQALPKILADSRAYQADVSTRLSEQVLGALHTLVRGFQAAHDASEGRLLGDALREAPDEVYGGLLTTLLRLVFLLYAEDRGLISGDPVYARHYAVGALFDKLREDHARHPDTMDQRYGAWARLITLFRMIHDGARHGGLSLPARHGQLFDPDAYPFLEGRARGSTRQRGARVAPPRVSDGVVYRVLDALLVLNGERLSYRTLDVEQIGSVYEAMMGFRLITVREASVALQGKRKKGAPPADPVVGLETLLGLSGRARLARLEADADVTLGTKAAAELEAAKTIDALMRALESRASPRSPGLLPAGGMALQPTEERRRSGSHYTPRALTEPIVSKTLEPLLAGLGPSPTPEQILGLKLCDPAMGSGAFLVAACRALGTALERAWQLHGLPVIPADEDPVLFARRTVAQRCLYGVDKNPFAVHLAKLSLWLVTLAREHPFTFLDHALRCGDSLVGLSREQIASFHWAPDAQVPALRAVVHAELRRAEALRVQIAARSASDDTREKQRLLEEADAAVARVRAIGDAVVDVFFAEAKPKAREALRARREAEVLAEVGRGWVSAGSELRPFHWEVEFPEVFGREDGGFDGFVGNPPYRYGKGISSLLGVSYAKWLQVVRRDVSGNADLAASFWRVAWAHTRVSGTIGLLTTKTISEGATRSSGLGWICRQGGSIFWAISLNRWPGSAAVSTATVVLQRGTSPDIRVLDGVRVQTISSFLIAGVGEAGPARLAQNTNQAFVGYFLRGSGFTFEGPHDCEETWSLDTMRSTLLAEPQAAQRIHRYIRGECLDQRPSEGTNSYAFFLSDLSEAEAEAGWPTLTSLARRKVKPGRDRLGDSSTDRAHKKSWWRFGNDRPAMRLAIRGLSRMLVTVSVSKYTVFIWYETTAIITHNLVVFANDSDAFAGVLQSRVHEVLAQFSSGLDDRGGYRPTASFETFPFPPNYLDSPTLAQAGQTYYDHRAALMVANDQGLTATYNRFHDPDERDPGILRLRELHAAMDRAVLDAYGWTDLQPTCDFLLDHDDDDDEPPAKKPKKKPYRYRWPDDVRDEVLARLLALNAERAAEERRLGLEATLARASIDDDDDDDARESAPAARPKPARKSRVPRA